MIRLNFAYDLTWPRKSTFSGQKLAFSWFCSTDVKNYCFQKWRYWLVLSLSWLYWPLGIQWRCLFFRNNITWRHYDVKFLILSLKSQFFWFLTLYSIQFNDVFVLKMFHIWLHISIQIIVRVTARHDRWRGKKPSKITKIQIFPFFKVKWGQVCLSNC